MEHAEFFNWGIMLTSVVILLWIGFKTEAIAQQDDESGFLLAGRTLTPFVGASTLVATGFSGWGFMGSPGIAYQYGAIEVLANFMFAPAIIIGILYFGNYMQNLAMDMGSNTIPEFIAQRHADTGYGRTLQAVSSVIIVMLLLVFLTGQIKALGLLSASWLGITTHQGAFMMIGVIILYTVLGGLAAVAWTDTFMVLGMAIAAIIIATQIFTHIHLTDMISTLSQTQPEHINPTTAQPYGEEKSSVFLVFPYAFMFTAVLPYMAVRFLAFKPNTNFRVVACYATPLALLLSLIPIVGLYMSITTPNIANADNVMPIYLKTFLHPVVGSIITLFILFAMQSTANSLLHTVSSAISHDLRQAFWPNKTLSEKHTLYLNRGAVFFLGMLAFFMMLYSPDLLLQYLGYLGTGTLLATLAGAVFVGTFWKGNAYGALGSMVIGFSTSAACLMMADMGWVIGPLLGVVTSMISYVIISMLTQRKRLVAC